MARYQYAKNGHGEIVKAVDLVGIEDKDEYICIGCENSLIAKVNGRIKKPHFAHKTVLECNGETYLHRLGKRAFIETYQKCLAENEPFYITFHVPKKCEKFKRTIRKHCDLGYVEKQFDLTRYFSQIQVEKRHAQFIPDLLLTRQTNNDDCIYIEIAVTHFLSEKKESFGKRIIEIPLDCEDDVEKIYKANLRQNDALFIGFNQESVPIVDADCKCIHKRYFLFLVWDSGKAWLGLEYLSDIKAKLVKYQDKIEYSNIIETDLKFENSNVSMGYAHGDMFIAQLKLAVNKKVPVKSCFLCKYSGDNYNYTEGLPIYCRAKKKACNSNKAAECDWYRLS